MYNTYYPQHKILRDYIKSFWVLKSDDNPSYTIVQPTPTFDVIFSYKNPTSWTNNGSEISLKDSYISGIRDKTYIIKPQGHIEYFAIEFKLGGLYHFVGSDISNLISKPVELSSMKRFKILQDKLLEKRTTEERLEVAEEELIKLFFSNNNVSYDDKVFQYVINFITETKGQCRINQLCDYTNIYPKKMERLFKRYTGINPKQLVKLVRFDNAFNLILNKSDSDWLSIVYDSGYFDQSHFIKEFNLFTGTSPVNFYENILPQYT
jgi:AraC-like DNA-binding protein